MSKYYISRPVMATCLGLDVESTFEKILEGKQDFFIRNNNNILVGRVPLEGEDIFNLLVDKLITDLRFQTKKILEKYSAERVGLSIGGCDYNSQLASKEHRNFILSGSFGSYNVDMQNPYRPVQRFAESLGLKGPSFSVASACASGITSVIRAIDLIEAGGADAMLVGGVDFASDLIVSGFSSLSAVSEKPTNPFSANRSGITLGDGAALYYVTRDQIFDFPVAITGFAEASDGYNMTSPDPEGVAVKMIFKKALDMSGHKPEDVGYLNLHGTGTAVNDAMESKAVFEFFGDRLNVSSTKSLTGHTLGSAGAVGSAICAMLLASKQPVLLPPHIYDGVRDSKLPKLNFVEKGNTCNLMVTMNSAFAFGGSNAVLILERC